MNKYICLLFCVALLAGTTFAADNEYSAKSSNTSKDYDFDNYSYNVSDEQLQKESEQEVFEEEKKASLWSKIINSSHFSSNTATRTYVPINKVE